MRTQGDFAYTQNRQIFIPDRKITTDDPSYVYVPLRGYCGSLAVFDIDDRCVGWIPIDVLGYPDVKTWMEKTGWRDGGY